ncbi:MAG: MgtC/SapB family protein [Agathobaculum sp.]|jgi:putative Mg2+ transporter-C (MgtC) family protein|uniref:MgtC/SapB family protein n=1 Tax=Agathobaculum sp. TaxID=2048138 RepID=UPI003D938B73
MLPWNMELVCVVRLLVASACGLVIGIERQSRMKGAGMKTHMMVALGSALMMLVSKYGFFDVIPVEGASVDVSRVAASIAAGIGFLGAGVIFVRRGSVVGLTTAAGLWTTTGVGMAVGSGLYLLGLVTTALMLVSQVVLRRVEQKGSVRVTELCVQMAESGANAAQLRAWLAAEHIEVKEVHTERKKEDTLALVMVVVLPHGYDRSSFLRLPAEVNGVLTVAA